MGLVVGWVSAPGMGSTGTTFEATHSLIVKPGVTNLSVLLRASTLAELGAVPTRVASQLAIDREQVQSMVSTNTPPNTGLLLITSRSTHRAQAEALANATAEELIMEMGGPSAAPVETLEPAVAEPLGTDDVVGPRSRVGRALLLGAFGLALGLLAAFAVDRFDDKIRSKRGAEGALGVPVIAEVPVVHRSIRDSLLNASQPSPAIEAYRRLRTSVDRTAGPVEGNPQILVVTSPTGGEGTTTTVAHLAAALGETGRSVLVISADLRHPQLHHFFDRAVEPGLTDLLGGAPDIRRVTDLNLATTVRGVRFVPSGAPVPNPAPILHRIGEHLSDARNLADIVLVDSPPLLTTSEAAELARHADGVLLVVKAGRTSVRAARHSSELLERLGLPVVGAVLVGVNDAEVRA